MFLVLLETHGNQAYVYATNRQKDNVGASALTKSTVDWVGAACARDGRLVPIANTSGKAVVLVAAPGEQGEALARTLITEVSGVAAERAPGLDLSGVFLAVSEQDLRDRDGQAAAMTRLHRLAAEYASARLAPAARFSRLPFTRICSSSGLPAARVDAASGELVDAVSHAKRSAARSARVELVGALREAGVSVAGADTERAFVLTLDRLGRVDGSVDGEVDLDQVDTAIGRGEAAARPLESQWIGVVHADGNLVGDVLTRVTHYMDGWRPDRDGPVYRSFVDAGVPADGPWLFYGEVSEALDRVTRAAYVAAAAEVVRAFADYGTDPDGRMPIVPVVPVLLGADDLTVVVAGRYALLFAVEFLRVFESGSRADPVLGRLLLRPDGVAGLTAAAGLAIVKPKFPFHAAYTLAEALCASAKRASRRQSMLDFHVLFDSGDADLTRLRSGADSFAGKLSRPYVVCDDPDTDTWRAAVRRLEATRSPDPVSDRPLSRTRLAALRRLLIGDRWDELSARFAQYCAEAARAKRLAGPNGDIVWDEPGAEGALSRRSSVIDTIDLLEVLPPGYRLPEDREPTAVAVAP